MNNTPKLPEWEEQLKNIFIKYGVYGDPNVAIETIVLIDSLIAKELATLKAQVRKEIEDCKRHGILVSRGMQNEKVFVEWNAAVEDCLSIPSLSEDREVVIERMVGLIRRNKEIQKQLEESK